MALDAAFVITLQLILRLKGRRSLKTIIRIALWLLVALNALAIYSFSAETGPASSKTSAQVTEVAVRMLTTGYDTMPQEQQAELIQRFQLPVRKTAHFLAFASLAFFLMLALAQHPIPKARRILLALLCSVVYAIFDELHQSLVPERAYAVVDIVIDSLGASIGLLFSLFFKRVRRTSLL